MNDQWEWLAILDLVGMVAMGVVLGTMSTGLIRSNRQQEFYGVKKAAWVPWALSLVAYVASIISRESWWLWVAAALVFASLLVFVAGAVHRHYRMKAVYARQAPRPVRTQT